MGRLENRTAVIVHVGSAMARACALRFAAEGAAIMAVDPSAETLQNFARAVTASGRRCLVQRARPDDEQEIMQVAEVCGQAWESVSILLICAALLDWWPAGKDTMRDWEQAIRVNLLAPVFYTKALQPALARSGSGSIIYYGSVDGIYGNPRLPAYSAARGGLIPFTHIAAHEYGPQGIRVNYIAGAAISPADPSAPPTGQPMWDRDEAIRATPLGRTATPDDIADLALFLASAESAYITGAVLTVDGGRTSITPGTGIRPR
jgi:NAD(P)-dependent dehydrogenase (short-subunit alcohol dehydrogenase family)